MGDNDQWDGAIDSTEDPEEKKVICCAIDSFVQYAKVSHFNVTHLRRQSFYALPQAQWQMLSSPPFNFLDTLDRTDDAIESNAVLARAIAKNGIESFGLAPSSEPDVGADHGEPLMSGEWVGIAKHGDIDKARSTLRQFYRDWSAAGAAEREASFAPVFRAAERQRQRKKQQQRQDEEHVSILVPGAGLGRLVYELCLRGYHAEGNEISYHQLLASSYILNCTHRAGQHTIYPWVHTFSNHRTRANHLRSYPVPDVHPATELHNAALAWEQARLGGDDGATPPGQMSMSAADFLCLYNDDDHISTYDLVATVFFLDTAPNLIRYLETIFRCLRPGGALVNVGPLLWHFENSAPGNRGRDDDGDGEHDWSRSSGIADPGSFELADDEVMALVEKVGFVVEERETGLDAPYIQDGESMLLTVYKASAWVARKPDQSS